MNKFILTNLLLGTMSAVAANNPHFILFDQPFVLTRPNVRVDVERVEEKFNEKTNAWTVAKIKKINATCNVTLKISGRDFARQNKLIGEHYTGETLFSCLAENANADFVFKRTIYLGIRNCVKSETYTDNDFCDIYAVVLGEEQVQESGNSPVILNEREKKIYLRVSSTQAGTAIGNNSLVPMGVRLTTLNAFQMLKLSMDFNGSRIFIEKPNALSNLEKGQNLYLSLSAQSVERDQALRASVEADLQQLSRILDSIQSSQTPGEEISKQTNEFLKTLSHATKALLAIVSPVHFIQLESALNKSESTFVNLWNKLKPNSKFSDSLQSQYGELFEQFQNMKTYATERSSKNDQSNDALREVFAGNLSTVSVNSDENNPQLGKTFLRSASDQRSADHYSSNDCWGYLGRFSTSIRAKYTCSWVRKWNNGYEHFAISKVDVLK